MIKFELSNGKIVEIPESKANKISFFRGSSSFAKENEYDFSQYSSKTMNVLFDYLNDKELLQKEIKDNEELFNLANYLGDDKFSYEIKKQNTLAQKLTPIIMMILREHLYKFPSNADKLGVKEALLTRQELSKQSLEDTFEYYKYDYDTLIGVALEALFLDNELPISNLEDFQRKGLLNEDILDNYFKKHVLKKDEEKQNLLKEIQITEVLNFGLLLKKDDAYYFHKRYMKDLQGKKPTLEISMRDLQTGKAYKYKNIQFKEFNISGIDFNVPGAFFMSLMFKYNDIFDDIRYDMILDSDNLMNKLYKVRPKPIVVRFEENSDSEFGDDLEDIEYDLENLELEEYEQQE